MLAARLSLLCSGLPAGVPLHTLTADFKISQRPLPGLLRVTTLGRCRNVLSRPAVTRQLNGERLSLFAFCHWGPPDTPLVTSRVSGIEVPIRRFLPAGAR